MLFPSHLEIDRFVSYRWLFFFVGLALIAFQICIPAGWRVVFITGFTLFSVGIYAAALRRWRTETGLWMLAALLAAFFIPAILYFEVLHWQEVAKLARANGVAWPQLRLAIDATLALLLSSYAVKLIIGIAIENFRMTR